MYIQSSTPLVLRQDHGAVTHLVLNQPLRRNCLSLAMLAALQAALDQAGADQSVRVIVLSGQGSAFCAGHDLRELTAHRADADKGAGFFSATMQQCSALMQSILALPQPVIAAVEGLATAAGCQLVATCDLAIAAGQASFCTPGVDIGLFCSTPMVALSRNVPRKAALGMLLTGEPIGAAEALRIGLVNQIADAGGAVAAALGLAQKVAKKPRRTVAMGKKAFYAQAEMSLSLAYDHASIIMAQCLLGADASEGIDAFLHKREPHWAQD